MRWEIDTKGLSARTHLGFYLSSALGRNVEVILGGNDGTRIERRNRTQEDEEGLEGPGQRPTGPECKAEEGPEEVSRRDTSSRGRGRTANYLVLGHQ